jgi:peptidase E
MDGTILALGGGGFSMSEGESPLDGYLLSLTGKDRPRVCFVPTASGDDRGYMLLFQDRFADQAETHVLSLFGRADDRIANLSADPKLVLDMDVVYVGGGSTANLLAIWRLHGLPDLLRQAAAQGTVLAGISAGMNCWFEGSVTDSFGPLAPLADGLGFLPGSACPHYDGEADRRPSYLRMVEEGVLDGGYAAEDYCALLWRDGKLDAVLSERPDAHAYRVTRNGTSAHEERVPAKYLGGS